MAVACIYVLIACALLGSVLLLGRLLGVPEWEDFEEETDLPT